MYGIEKAVSGVTVITGEGINLYQMLALETRLKMEQSGLKFTPSGRTIAKQLFGLTGNRDKVLKALVALRAKRFPLGEAGDKA